MRGGDARYRVIAFRDHREQGDLWTVHDSNPFTKDSAVLKGQLDALVASGGGDGPEAQLDALDAALRSSWSGTRGGLSSSSPTLLRTASVNLVTLFPRVTLEVSKLPHLVPLSCLHCDSLDSDSIRRVLGRRRLSLYAPESPFIAPFDAADADCRGLQPRNQPIQGTTARAPFFRRLLIFPSQRAVEWYRNFAAILCTWTQLAHILRLN